MKLVTNLRFRILSLSQSSVKILKRFKLLKQQYTGWSFENETDAIFDTFISVLVMQLPLQCQLGVTGIPTPKILNITDRLKAGVIFYSTHEFNLKTYWQFFKHISFYCLIIKPSTCKIIYFSKKAYTKVSQLFAIAPLQMFQTT